MSRQDDESGSDCGSTSFVPVAIAAGKAARLLDLLEQEDYMFELETESVYGAAIAMPQLARSCKWTSMFTLLVIRTYFMLMVNFAIQGMLIYVIFQEFLVFDELSGVMHLCSFGRDFSSCPEGNNCVGPGGTTYTKYNLMGDFGDWQSQVLVRDSLLKLYPNKSATIMQEVVPGEYGMESPLGRYVCIFLFVLAIMSDLKGCLSSMNMLAHLPTEEGCWISYEKSSEENTEILGEGPLDWLKYKVAGIPFRWKLFYVVTVYVPKLILWIGLLVAGCTFLFQTAGIVDLVLNSLALGFVLGIDELIMARFSTHASLHIMNNMQGYRGDDMARKLQELEDEHDADAMEHYDRDNIETFWQYFRVFPKRILMCIAAIIFAYYFYFLRHCLEAPDGSMISKSTYPPLNVFFNPINAIFHTMQRQATATWELPAATAAR